MNGAKGDDEMVKVLIDGKEYQGKQVLVSEWGGHSFREDIMKHLFLENAKEEKVK